MIQLAPQMRIRVAIEPADFRKGIDGLARLARDELDSDPFSGWIFVFRNRKATAVKILVYDGQGFWLCYKRLSSGRFRFWPGGKTQRSLEAHELQVLLSAGDYSAARAAPAWRRLRVASQ
ncbi:MAG: IS66 family insertion sequence element accessory protein TnpB [bacterium]|nr:IS66 family insertion sequence element accessory protein TnpB [bacterium]